MPTLIEAHEVPIRRRYNEQAGLEVPGNGVDLGIPGGSQQLDVQHSPQTYLAQCAMRINQVDLKGGGEVDCKDRLEGAWERCQDEFWNVGDEIFVFWLHFPIHALRY